MLVAAWFLFLAIVIVFGFGLVIATFIHWYKESKARRQNDVPVKADAKPLA